MSRARDLANGITTFAPKASPTFSGTISGGTYNGTLGDSIGFSSKFVVFNKLFNFWDSGVHAGIVGNGTGTEVVSASVGNATFANSIYTFTCNVSYNVEDASLTDRNDFGMGAWLQNASGSKKYRFGFYNDGSTGTNWPQRHSGMASTVGHYWLADSDGGHISASWDANTNSNFFWNQTQFSATDITGNRSSSETQGNVASNFSAGEALTLKVVLGSHHAGINYNSANTDGAATTATKSFYCIKEYTQIGS